MHIGISKLIWETKMKLNSFFMYSTCLSEVSARHFRVKDSFNQFAIVFGFYWIFRNVFFFFNKKEFITETIDSKRVSSVHKLWITTIPIVKLSLYSTSVWHIVKSTQFVEWHLERSSNNAHFLHFNPFHNWTKEKIKRKKERNICCWGKANLR